MAIQNKITVIAGVTGGLGRVVAREFAAQGASLSSSAPMLSG